MAEISELAQGSSPSQAARRKALFSDLRTPSPWSTFCRETLLLLGKDYQNLVRRGKPTPPGKVTHLEISSVAHFPFSPSSESNRPSEADPHLRSQNTISAEADEYLCSPRTFS